MRTRKPRSFIPAICSLSVLLIPGTGFAVEPGVDIAVPRVAIVTVSSAFVFQPNLIAVEQGDYVRWQNVSAGTSHTTTSGSGCVANNLWNASLAAGTQFTRLFLESPASLPYYCIPHCTLGMTGSIRLTAPILVQALDNFGTLALQWNGGGPTYQVFRSDFPSFVGATPIPPDGGDTGTSFSDSQQPSPGGVSYYLVMNK
ncbi:MAG TPA: plastocyanin/azurin family copper-binding protein [Candidatus Polarisedimenticolia bacterium]|nr:plastocyanin/azurin family copper-binding protein [Candidatus Polarisedimenticolia bacterium]